MNSLTANNRLSQQLVVSVAEHLFESPRII